MSTLDQALFEASPRLSPSSTPLRSLLIHGALLILWIGLLVRAFVPDGLFAWTAGIVYVAYDTLLLAFVFVQTLPLWRAGREVAAAIDRPRPTLGVIVAAHDEAGVLPATLAALLDQTDPPDLVLIADDGSTDATPDVLLRAYGLVPAAPGAIGAAAPDHPTLRWLRVPHGGKARALNAAAVLVGTEIVLTVDADTLLDRDAIAAVRRAFADDPDLVAATGILTPFCGPGPVNRLFAWFQTYEYIRNFLSRHAWMRMDALLLISGAFASFRRRALLDVGGFDPECLVEDYELIHRLRRYAARLGLPWRTAVLGGARARTEAPGTVAGFLRQRRRWFGGFLQTQYWYRDMVGDARYGRLGTLMLPIKAVDTFQPLYGLTALALIPVYLGTGRLSLVAAIGGVIGVKLGIDLLFHTWSVLAYRRWVGASPGATLPMAVVAALFEPFLFQPLRHFGAAWGWLVFLTGRLRWGRRVRDARVATPARATEEMRV